MFSLPSRPLRLRQPVGNGLANEPDDVMAVQRRLGAQGLYRWDDDGPSGFIDTDLLAGLRQFQQANGLSVDGWLQPGGETERNLNRRMGQTPDFNPNVNRSEPVDILGEVGNGRANDEADVTGVKRALAALGLYQYDVTAEPSPFIDRPMLDAIKTFQQGNGLKVDGWLGCGGETEAAMNAALGVTGAVGSDSGPVGSAGNDRLAAQTTGGRKGVRNLLDLFLRTVPPVAPKPEPPPAPPQPAPMPIPPSPAPQPEREPKPAPPTAIPELDSTILPGRPAEPQKPLSIQDKTDFSNGLTSYLNEQTDAGGENDDLGGRLGKKATRDTNNIIVQECAKLLDGEFSHLKDKVSHIGGATIDGEGKIPVKEKYIKNPNAPADRKTLGAGFGDATHGNGQVQGPINSVTVRQTDGLPTAKEQRGLEKLGRLLGEDAIPWVRKLLDGYGPSDVDEVRRQAKAACRESFKRIERKLNEKAEPPDNMETKP